MFTRCFEINEEWELFGLGHCRWQSQETVGFIMGNHVWRFKVRPYSYDSFELRIVQDKPEVPSKTWIFHFKIRLTIKTTEQKVFRYNQNFLIDSRKCEGPNIIWNCRKGDIDTVSYDVECCLYEFKEPAICEEVGLHSFKAGEFEFMVSKKIVFNKVSSFKKQFKNADQFEMKADSYDGLYFMAMVHSPAHLAAKLLNESNIDNLTNFAVDLGARDIAKLCEEYMIANGEDWVFTRKLYLADKLGSTRFLNRAIRKVDYIPRSTFAGLLRDAKSKKLKSQTRRKMMDKLLSMS